MVSKSRNKIRQTLGLPFSRALQIASSPMDKLHYCFSLQVRRGASTYEEDEDHTRSIRYDHPQVVKPDTVSALTHALFEAHPEE